jgi:hypothetical protein
VPQEEIGHEQIITPCWRSRTSGSKSIAQSCTTQQTASYNKVWFWFEGARAAATILVTSRDKIEMSMLKYAGGLIAKIGVPLWPRRALTKLLLNLSNRLIFQYVKTDRKTDFICNLNCIETSVFFCASEHQ